MISGNASRFRRALYTWRQPLTRRPSIAGMPVSDLFVWRNSDDWSTYFELIDVPALFMENAAVASRHATIFFFDLDGREVLKKRVSPLPNKRETVDVGELVGRDHGEIGTFAVFHSETPVVVEGMGSYLTERGYVSYRYKNSPLRSYVHGNLDAVSLRQDGRLEFLGGRGLLSRRYYLQNELKGPARYELALVNPSASSLRCGLDIVSARSGKALKSKRVRLGTGEATLLAFKVDESEPVRITIASHLIMARPLVFHIQNSKLDVFHG